MKFEIVRFTAEGLLLNVLRELGGEAGKLRLISDSLAGSTRVSSFLPRREIREGHSKTELEKALDVLASQGYVTVRKDIVRLEKDLD